jgi:endonuclease-3
LSSWRRPERRRVRAIRDRLRLVYGVPLAKPHGHPIAELILTVLSQSTNDRNRDVAYLALRERFPTWYEVRDAPVDEIEEAIRPGGISKVKSARIKSILVAITETAPEHAGALPPGGSQAPDLGGSQASDLGGSQASDLGGSQASDLGGSQARDLDGSHAPDLDDPHHFDPDDPLSLDWLAGQPVPTAQAYLTSLPGVGRKTAACVLLFALGMRDVPVDTHVSRVGTRLGLFRPKAPFEEMHDAMLELTPPGEELELHLNLLRHGRRTCYARRPACHECALQRMCPSAFKVG